VRWQNWTHRPHEAARGRREAASNEQRAEAWQSVVGCDSASSLTAFSVARCGEAAGAAGGFQGSWAPQAQCSPQAQHPACFATEAAVARHQAARKISRSWQQRSMPPGRLRVLQQEFAASDPSRFRWPQQLGWAVSSTVLNVHHAVATVWSPQRHGAARGGKKSDTAASQTTVFETTRCPRLATITPLSTAPTRGPQTPR